VTFITSEPGDCHGNQTRAAHYSAMELELEPSNSIELHMGPVGQYEIIKTQLTTAGETEVDKDTVTVYTNVADAAHAL